MSADALIHAFRLPEQALVAQRIAKKLLLQQGAPTAADKRLINDTLDELWWQAALKPATVGVPAQGDVLELALVSAQLRPAASAAQARRLLQLIHRAIPYPVLLVAHPLPGAAAGALLSLAHKRASLGEAGQWVLAEAAQTHAFDPARPSADEAAFLASLALERMPRSALVDLAALYQGYADRVTALAVARLTGCFAAPGSAAQAAAQREALAERQRVQQELAAARGAAARARQLKRRVELNLQIQRLQGRVRQIDGALNPDPHRPTP